MKTTRRLLPIALCALAASVGWARHQAAQQVLPKPEQAFADAKIGRTFKDSHPGSMALTKPPAGAPNVLGCALQKDAARRAWGMT